MIEFFYFETYFIIMDSDLRKRIISILLEEKKKEYLCHIQFVVEIGLQLAKEFNINPDIIEVACLLHDIGRDKELHGEKHAQAGKRITGEILSGTNFSEKQKEKIFSCILSHNLQEIPVSIEEQIVRTADGGSKVEYHEAFMLLCKKNTYAERLGWGKKYLKDGYESISLESYKEKIKSKYLLINGLYDKILSMI